MSTSTRHIVYDDRIARWFIAASVIFGIVGILVGLVIATQLAAFQANLSPYLTFGRLRPLHTNAVIFAFVGNGMFAGIYYSTQRLLKVRMASDLLSKIHFWGWQLIIVAAALTLPLGITTGKEYAELEWPIDIAIAVVWVVFAVNFFWTLAKRNEKHLYVAIWFYIATILTVAVLHIVNSLALPVSPWKSYGLFAGVQSALVQWWYGHNAVAFFLTTPILGMMYYFVPKAAARPVFSYRLSVVHFWALVFLYIWAGPHHLLYTALPEWAQTLGMLFSLMLWAPSWGGMVNGLLTLRGAWDRVRTDPVLKFFAASVTFYGMSTFEGPLLSIKSVNGLAHYTDWIVGHAHAGGLGWNGFFAAGTFYWMVPRLFGTKLYSEKAANTHFYIGTIGILLYVVSMWIAGVTQGLMWREMTGDGGMKYSFLETIVALRPMYWTRLAGGLLFFAGFVMMAWNLLMTARAGKAVEVGVDVVVREETPGEPGFLALLFGRPVVISVLVTVLAMAAGFLAKVPSTVVIAFAIVIGVGGTMALYRKKESWHGLLEGRAAPFTVLVVIAVIVGGVAEIIPSLVTGAEAHRSTTQEPYTALELEGRDVYIREGCYTCHSQMIRPFVWETQRYGDASTIDDSIYDHPFQWGSKRTGPDLARESKQARSNLWHYQHLVNPRELSGGSNMPPYAFLEDERVNLRRTSVKMRAMRNLGVPYESADVSSAATDARGQGRSIAESLRADGNVEIRPDSEMVALIAYLQRLGRPTATATATATTVQAAPSGEVR
jgi:cytochrome c oxidase cbb3-type subunit I/II